ncbi:hypothetical protein [Tsuneonella sp. HG222]
MTAAELSLPGEAAAAPARAYRLPPLWLAWLALAICLTLLALPALRSFTTQDPDDYMRLLQVRDWVNGQGWFDTRQYRFDPPRGADMHWVRLVDLPIAAVLVIAKQFLAQRPAEIVAMTVVPLLQMYVAMRLLAAIVGELGGNRTARLVAAVLVPAFPLLLTNFVPTRIDHHGWQAIAALTVAWCLLKDSYRHALAAGVAAAAGLIISLESIAMTAVFGGLFALRYWLWGKRQHEAFLAGLAVALPVLFAVFRPLSEIGTALCDLPTWPHFLAFGGGALVAALSRVLPRQDKATGRLLATLPVGAVAAAALFVPLGMCVISPLELDPFLKNNWFDNMAESASIAGQSVSIATMTLWTIALALVAGWSAWRTGATDDLRIKRALFTAAALGAGAFSLLIMRAGLTAQLMTVPLAALLIVRLWPRARGLRSPATRILATLALIGFATPMFASAATKRLDRSSALTQTQVPGTVGSQRCDFDRLNAVPAARMFATIDRGPELLARTPHSAVMSGYHRNREKMIETIKGFAAPLAESEAIIRANNSDYVVACTSSPDLWVAAKAGSDNLADRIIAGRVPAWLEPVKGFEEGALKLYRVR